MKSCLKVLPNHHSGLLPANTKPQLHCFDFDGTISSCDSLLEFVRFTKGAVIMYLVLALLSPLIIFERFFPPISGKSKQLMLSIFFKGCEKQRLLEMGKLFFKRVLQKNLKPKAIQAIEKLKENPSNVIVIVSASVDFWMKPVADYLKTDLICTEANFNEGRFTGNFEGRNCKGIEKVLRLSRQFNIGEYIVHAYGNSTGDKEMLKIASKSYYRCF